MVSNILLTVQTALPILIEKNINYKLKQQNEMDKSIYDSSKGLLT